MSDNSNEPKERISFSFLLLLAMLAIAVIMYLTI